MRWFNVIFPCLLSLALSASAASQFAVTPYLQRPATDAMTIIFFTTGPGTATVEAWPANAARPEVAPYRDVTVGEWAQALTNNAYQAKAGVESKTENMLYKHRVRFEGLKPNRSYDYTVKLDGGATYSNRFRTAPDRNTPIRFVSYADCETAKSQWKGYTANLNRMKERGPDLITSAGDLTARGGIQAHWNEFWKQNAGGNGIGYTDILGSIPMITAIGNHDLFDNVAHSTSGWYHDAQGEFATEKFLSYFEFNSNNVPYTVRDGTNIPETRDMSQLFHREDYGPVTLIFLDSNNGRDCKNQAEDEQTSSNGIHDQDSNYCKYNNTSHEPGGMNRWKGARHPDFNPGSPQYDWLTNQLADAQQKSRFTFVFNHHCPYSAGSHNKSWTTGEDASSLPLRVLTETMVRYGVEGWYCGHDELLEHAITNGWEYLPKSMGGGRRRHTLSIYDLGCSGDDDARGSSTMPPLGYWIGGSGNYGESKYGFLETDVTTNKNGKWTCTITPVQGSSGNYLNAQIVYVENPDRGESENDLVYAQATNKSNPIDGASQTRPSDWLPWTKPPEGSDDDPGYWIEDPVPVTATKITYNRGEQTGEQFKGFATEPGREYAWGKNGKPETEWVKGDGTPCELKKPEGDGWELMVR